MTRSDTRWIARAIVGKTENQRGFVLLTVLWFMALLMLMATTFIMSVRTHTRISGNQAHSIEARLNADAAVRLIAYGLATTPETAYRLSGRSTDGNIFACQLPDGEVALVSIQDHAGLVDLNAAPPELLRKLFISVGSQPSDADWLANAIVDFRDPDNDSLNGGPEISAYQDHGLLAGPKNGFFQSRWELDQVPGMNSNLLESIEARVTVFSRSDGIDPDVTPLDLQLSGNEIRKTQGQTFTIIAEAKSGRRGRFVRRAIVRITRQPGSPYQVLSWERGLNRLSDRSTANLPIRACA